MFGSTLAIALFFVATSTCATTIHIEPGPHGGDRVVTPWGDYIVVTRDDGSIWVGTEAEYDMGRARALAAQDGMRPTTVDGKTVFVSAALPSLLLGDIETSNIATQILFGVKPNDFDAHRPAKPKGEEYVSTGWTQSSRGKVTTIFADTETHRLYAPYDCGFDAPTSSGHCEYLMPISALPHKFVTLFVRTNAKPAALPVRSITSMHYGALADKARTGTPIEGDDLQDLHSLHALDPSIPDVPPGR